MASKETTGDGQEAEATGHESTATSAATADPAKQELIRRHREQIAQAQAEIRKLTGGRESRAGSDVGNVGFSHQVRTQVVINQVEQTVSPTIHVTESGEVKQLDPPRPVPSHTGETTESGSSGATGGTSDVAAQGAKKPSALRDASYGTPATERSPNDDEELAIRLILEDDRGHRARIHVHPEVHPAIGNIISINNALAPGVAYRGKVTEMSELLIVPKDKMTDLRRTERSRRRRAEREAARQAAEAYQKAMGTEAEVILDISTAQIPPGEDPPLPVQDDTSGELVIADPTVTAGKQQTIGDQRPTGEEHGTDKTPAEDPQGKTAADTGGDDGKAADETAGKEPAAATAEKDADHGDKPADKQQEEGGEKQKEGGEKPKETAADTEQRKGEKPKGTGTEKAAPTAGEKSKVTDDPKPGFSSWTEAAGGRSDAAVADVRGAGIMHDDDDDGQEDFIGQDAVQKAMQRGKTSVPEALQRGGKKRPAAIRAEAANLEIAAWLRNVEDMNPPTQDDPPPLKEIMGMTKQVLPYGIRTKIRTEPHVHTYFPETRSG